MSSALSYSPAQHHQQTAQRLLDHCDTFKQLFQDQWLYLWTLTPENLFQIDAEKHILNVADGLLYVRCQPALYIEFSTPYPDIDVQAIADFIFNDVLFIHPQKNTHHAMFVQSKVQVFRQLLVEEVFKWVDGENRVEQCLYNLSFPQAQQLDQIMIEAGYYNEPYLSRFVEFGQEIPLQVELNFKHLNLVNSILGEEFLAVQKLVSRYQDLCASAAQLLPGELYRLVEVNFDEQFSLAQINQKQPDFILLRDHARQNPHLLSLTQWMIRGYWQYRDLLAKKHLLDPESPYWVDSIAGQRPIFHSKRAVNWLFRQDIRVIDWIGTHLSEVNVRLAVTAISYADTSACHPHVIRLTLKYFEQVIGRLFILEVSRYADKQSWFHEFMDLHAYALKDEVQTYIGASTRSYISPTVLYTTEWLHLLAMMDREQVMNSKLVFRRITQVMQAYMLFLQQQIQDIPDELVDYIEPGMQHLSHFYQLMQNYQLDINQFRSLFKHPNSRFNRSNSVFDAYVADYLLDYFREDQPIAKNMTWTAWYQRALRWHQQIHFEDTLTRLKLRKHKDQWRRISPHAVMFSKNWKFVELNSLEQIIHESVSYKHCLALAYTERIIDGEYVAFHMSALNDDNVHLTLGCFYRFDQLHFDQLRLPNNEVADAATILEAKEFIQEVNQYLIWDLQSPKSS